MGITIYDVATGAGVSPATVSRVLAGGASVAPDTAERVRQVVERLGYRPDRVAQSLRRQRSGLVGLVLPERSHPHAAFEAVIRTERTLAERDRSLLVATSDGTRELAAAERLAAHGVDALLITRRTGRDPIDPDAFEVPVVLVDSGAVDGVDTVRVDHAAGIAQIVRFLVREGAQRLAFVGEGSLSNVGTEQLEGFASATSAISEVETVALRLGPSTHEFAATTARELIGSPSPPDAYVCGSDLVASTLSAAFDVDDPERPLVVGYGAEPHSELVVPTLTTARLPIAEVAEEAVRLVMQRVDGLESDPIDIALAPSLVVGQSA